VTQRAIADFSSCRKPEYPHADIAAGHEGTVTVEFLVGEDGRVAGSSIAKSSGYASMDEAARGALALCSFHPALKAGKPIRQLTHVQYVWTLE
jgi:TonB family protein